MAHASEMQRHQLLAPASIAITRQHNRILELSQQCTDDADSILTGSAYVNAFGALINDILGFECVNTTNASTIAIDCTIDSPSLESHDDLLNACRDAGGIPFLTNANISCALSNGNQTGFDNLTTMGNPDCFPPSCLEEELVEEAMLFLDAEAADLEQFYLLEFDTAECTGTLEVLPTPNGTDRTSSAFHQIPVSTITMVYIVVVIGTWLAL